jgi:hypothetical protein
MAKPNRKKAPVAEWDALLERYPLASPWEMARQLTVVVGGNAIVLRLLITGRMLPFHLVALVAIEAVLLSAIAWSQTRMVPRSALMDKPQPLRQRLGVLAFGAFWLAFVYAIIFGAMLQSGPQVIAALRQPLATLEQGALLWPLGITLTFALVDAAVDWQHWRSSGGFFLSTPGFNSAARWLTLFLGGIPFLVPFAAGVFAIATLGQHLAKRGGGGGASGVARFAPFIAPALLIGMFGAISLLLRAGVSGWAIGYCSAKLVSESFLVFLPLIATRARAEESVEPKIEPKIEPKAEPKARRRSKKR